MENPIFSAWQATSFLDLEAYLGGEFLHPGGAEITQELLQRLRLPPGGLALELGCGTGTTAALVARETGARVVALDLLPAMLAAAQARLLAEQLSGFVHLVQANVNQRLPFARATFDAVYAESVLALAAVEPAISEGVRVLRPCGQMVLNERVWKSGVSPELVNTINALSRRVFGIPAATHRLLDRNGWLQLLQKSGLIHTQAIAIDELLSTTGRHWHLQGRLRRGQRYLARPQRVWHSIVFKVMTRKYRTLWSHLESYLFLAQKPE